MMFNQAATGIHSNLTRLKHRLRSLCYTYIYSLCSDCSPLTVSENAAFKKLLNRKDLIFSKPDIGNGVVVMDRSDYINKLYNIVNDSSKFNLLTNDPTEKR